MNVVEKAIAISAVASIVLIIFTNPVGTQAAGTASSGVVTAWFKGLQGRG